MKAFQADWRSPEQYPEPGCDNLRRLAWECVRRNAEYASDVAAIQQLAEGEFENGIKSDSSSCLDVTTCQPIAISGETACEYQARMKQIGQNGRINKPARIFRNRWCLKSAVDPNISYDRKIIVFILHTVKTTGPVDLLPRFARLLIWPNEILLRFRLDVNFQSQLNDAMIKLISAAEKYAALIGKVPHSSVVPKATKTRRKTSLDDAHFWLRCYDAYQMPKELLGDKERKRAIQSGPTAILKVFSDEQAKISEKRFINRNQPSDWNVTANEYINGKKYLTLLHPKPRKRSDQEADQSKILRGLAKTGF